MDQVVAPALAASRQGAAETVRAAREAAQADPEGRALAGVLVAAPVLGQSA